MRERRILRGGDIVPLVVVAALSLLAGDGRAQTPKEPLVVRWRIDLAPGVERPAGDVLKVTIGGPEPATVRIVEIPIGSFVATTLDEGRYSLATAEDFAVALIPDRIKVERTASGSGTPREIVLTLHPAAPLTVRTRGKPDEVTEALPLWFRSVEPPGFEFRVTTADLDRPRCVPLGTWGIPDDSYRFRFRIDGGPSPDVRSFAVGGPDDTVLVLDIRRRPSDFFVFEAEFVDPEGTPIPVDLVTQARVGWGHSLCQVMDGEVRDGATIFATPFHPIRLVTLPPEAPTLTVVTPFFRAVTDLELPRPTETERTVRRRVVLTPKGPPHRALAQPADGTRVGVVSFVLLIADDELGISQKVPVTTRPDGSFVIPHVQYPFRFSAQPTADDPAHSFRPTPGSDLTVTGPEQPVVVTYLKRATIPLSIAASDVELGIGGADAKPRLLYLQPLTRLDWTVPLLAQPTTRLRHEWSRPVGNGAGVDLGPLPHGRFRVIVMAPELGTAQTEFEVGPQSAKPTLRFTAPGPTLHGVLAPPPGPYRKLFVGDGALPITFAPSLELELENGSRPGAIARVTQDGRFSFAAHQPGTPHVTVFEPGVGAWILEKTRLASGAPLELTEQPEAGSISGRVFVVGAERFPPLSLIVTSLRGGERAGDEVPRAEDLQAFPIGPDGRFRVFGILPGTYRVGLVLAEVEKRPGGETRTFNYLPETLRILDIRPGSNDLNWSLSALRPGLIPREEHR